ncbi:MAG TPA: alpha/beta hydrolase [Saprospiraceae bacterium]|nr:alpha/beta hydrolase [Saprospiraceae bacterium]HPI04863.1 alpha/beta hydrolase [Saprospiraceae bacterium]
MKSSSETAQHMNITKTFLTLTLLLLLHRLSAQKNIPLYAGQIPNSTMATGLKDSVLLFQMGKDTGHFVIRVVQPDLTMFLPEKSKSTGIAVVICPGGGYAGLAVDHEGFAMAKRFQTNGIAAFVLRYRLPNAAYMQHKEIVPLQDAQRAIQLVRENAAEWGIHPDKIGILGSSAGGHLASTVGTHFLQSQVDNPKKTSLRPDFMILNYPVISFADSLTHAGSRSNLIGSAPNTAMGGSEQQIKNQFLAVEKIWAYSSELVVTPQTPPTFITHAIDDTVVPVQNTLVFIAALQKNSVPVESFFYTHGGHGYGMDNPTSEVEWFDACLSWLLKMKKH